MNAHTDIFCYNFYIPRKAHKPHSDSLYTFNKPFVEDYEQYKSCPVTSHEHIKIIIAAFYNNAVMLNDV